MEERRKILEKFIQQCIEIEYIYLSADFQEFIHSPHPFIIKKHSLQEISQIVIATFPGYLETEVKQEYVQNLQFAVNNFTNAIRDLIVFKSTVDSCCNRMKKFQEGVANFMNSARQVSEVYLCRNFDTKNRDMFINPYWSLRDWVNSEILDTEAMLEAIHKLSEYDNLLTKLQDKHQEESKESINLKDGKKNFFTLFKIKTQDEAIKSKTTEVENLEKDITAIKEIRNTFYHVLLEVDIFKFISNKTRIYKKYLVEFCHKTIEEYEDLLGQIKYIQKKLEI